MNLQTAAQIGSQSIYMTRTDPRHFAGINGPQPSGNQNGTFAQLLMDGLGQVNRLEQDAQQLSIQAVTNPDSVDVHDVTIAAAKAELALSITKNVVDRVIQAYKEIQNVR